MSTSPRSRLAGHSGDSPFVEPLRRLLDHTRADVREAAAIGLGLPGDPTVADRLRALVDRLPPDPDGADLGNPAEFDVELAFKGLAK